MKKIVVIGLGPGELGQVTASAWEALLEGQPLYFRTGRHPVARYLDRQGIRFRTFDHLYQRTVSFEEVYRLISAKLIGATARRHTIFYAVPGHPMVGEASVEQLVQLAPRRGIAVKIIPGLSFLEPVLTALQIDLLDGVTVMDALNLGSLKEPHHRHLLIAQIFNRSVAFRAKLQLLELYPPSYPVKVIQAAGQPRERLCKVSLGRLDRCRFDHRTALYLPPLAGYGLGGLVEIMARLRAPGGCPWDKEQTHISLRQYLVEEAYEVIAAIERADDAGLKEELGDVLLQVIFHSEIAREEGRFNLDEVIAEVSAKLIRRHPHVFGTESAATISQVINRWEQIKKREKGKASSSSISVDHGLPALLRAYKIQKRAANLGFDWPFLEGALDKLTEEIAELADAYRQGNTGKIEEEYGDYLFAAVNVARFLKINPELALGKANCKFLRRFQYIEQQVTQKGKTITDYTLDELDRWWNEAKKRGK
ncbi:MAG: nucleoside triphosphate pyrophosphohydrolase [Bacillota bacterium]